MKTPILTTLGISQRDLVALHALQQVAHLPNHAGALYESLRTQLPMKTPARSYVFRTIQEMIEQGEIQEAGKEGRKVMVGITEQGRHRLTHFWDTYQTKFESVAHITQAFLWDFTHDGERVAVRQLSHEEQKYFSRLISVKDVLRVYVLQALRHHPPIIGGMVHRSLKERFGWQANESYFYAILREMENMGMIRGEWEDERTRTHRLLWMNPAGEAWYPILEQDTVERLKTIQRYVRAILALFQERAHPLSQI